MAQLGTIYEEGPYSFTASGAIRKGRAAKVVAASDKTAEECDTAGEASYGVCVGEVADTEQAPILRRGRFEEAVAGAALATRYTDLATDAEGRYVAAVTGDVVLGRNLTTAAGADSLFTIELDTAERVVPA